MEWIMTFPSYLVGNGIIIPTDELHHFSEGVGIPPPRKGSIHHCFSRNLLFYLFGVTISGTNNHRFLMKGGDFNGDLKGIYRNSV
jgi:hypothetical protein